MGLLKLDLDIVNASPRSPLLHHPHQLVCLTGSWSSLGSWIARLLLQHGFSVRFAIPLLSDELALMRSFPGAQERLQLVKVDLLDYCSLSELLEGCVGVFHVPAPSHDLNGTRDYPSEIIDNEVRGVLNVVEACANTPTVKKVVLTSCLSSVLWDKQYYASGVIVDEKNWSNLDFCRKEKMWSALCKTLVEKAAWALARDRDLDLVVMNPAMVVGPKCSNGRLITQLTSSSSFDQSGIFAYVHVDDLAAAHVLAFEADSASGRYICFEKLLTKSDIVEAARELYPNYPMSRKLESFNPCVLSNNKLKDLGVSFRRVCTNDE